MSGPFVDQLVDHDMQLVVSMVERHSEAQGDLRRRLADDTAVAEYLWFLARLLHQRRRHFFSKETSHPAFRALFKREVVADDGTVEEVDWGFRACYQSSALTDMETLRKVAELQWLPIVHRRRESWRSNRDEAVQHTHKGPRQTKGSRKGKKSDDRARTQHSNRDIKKRQKEQRRAQREETAEASRLTKDAAAKLARSRGYAV